MTSRLLGSEAIWVILILIFSSLGAAQVRKEHTTDLAIVPSGTLRPFFDENGNIAGRSKKEKVILVPINSFSVQIDLVTNKDFLEFVSKNRSWKKSIVKSVFADNTYLQHWRSDIKFSEEIKNLPVTNISWFAANEYCQSKGMRLLTTNEWEYLATFPIFLNGRLLNESEQRETILQWYGEPTKNLESSEVGKYRNSIGVRDLFGTVWEWTYDFNSVLMSTDNRSNSNKKNGLFCGGGAAGSASPSDYATFMRFAFRSSLKGRYCGKNLGFRCAL